MLNILYKKGNLLHFMIFIYSLINQSCYYEVQCLPLPQFFLLRNVGSFSVDLWSRDDSGLTMVFSPFMPVAGLFFLYNDRKISLKNSFCHDQTYNYFLLLITYIQHYTAPSWPSSYLTNRSQFMKVNNCMFTLLYPSVTQGNLGDSGTELLASSWLQCIPT